MTDIEYMKVALNEGKKCLKFGDVPIGAVIVYNDKIISKAYNQKEKNKLVIDHAEILAIKKACKKIKNDRLDDMVLYTTKEPCLMCMGVILSARIKKIIYGAKDKRFGTSNLAKENNFNHKCECVGGVLEEECSNMISTFFNHLRSKNEGFRKSKNSRKGKK